MFRAFTDHPDSVGETYLEHMGVASWFALNMFVAGFACAIHALLPFAFQKTGSERVKLLYDRMVANRRRVAQPRAGEARPFLGYAEGI